jgi:hypothetical protein
VDNRIAADQFLTDMFHGVYPDAVGTPGMHKPASQIVGRFNVTLNVTRRGSPKIQLRFGTLIEIPIQRLVNEQGTLSANLEKARFQALYNFGTSLDFGRDGRKVIQKLCAVNVLVCVSS